MRPIVLLSQRPDVSPADLLALSSGPIVACDCYVRGAEDWAPVPGGYASGRIVNVDHHADTPAMARVVSSANLALCRVRALGLPPVDAQIVITHADCDSILSAGILSGQLAPEPRYGEAALAADHTGAVNDIADLLQALDTLRNVSLSFEALAGLESGAPPTRAVQQSLNERRRKRALAAVLVRDGAVAMRGVIAVGHLPQALDGEFFAPLLPDAVVILLAMPHATDAARLDIKLRLGPAAPMGFSLHALGLPAFDPAYGGRWNAGSNRRGGGTTLSLEAYASSLQVRVELRLTALRRA